MPAKKPPVKAKAGKVRFHEEVKVKRIKPKGRGLPVNSPAFWVGDMGDDEFEGFGDQDGMVNGHLDLDQDYVMDSEEDDDDDDDLDDDDDSDEEDEDEDSGEDDQEIGQMGRQAVERLRDDLFAEEDGEGEREEGESDGLCCGLLLNPVCRPHESPEAHGSFEGANRGPGGRERCS